METYDEQLSALVADTAPTGVAPDDAELQRVWNKVQGGLGEAPARRPRLRLVVGAGLAAIALGSAGVAVAQVVEEHSARTGEGPADAEDLRLGGPGEKLDPSGSDFRDVIAEEAAGIPFPNDALRQATVDWWFEDLTRDVYPGAEPTRLSTGALRAWMAQDAVCHWANQWAVGTRSGDAALRAEAVEVISGADTWDAVTAIDPEPYSRPETREVQNRDGSVETRAYNDESHFYYLRHVEKAAAGTDTGAMVEALVSNQSGCSAYEVPDLKMADMLYAYEHGVEY